MALKSEKYKNSSANYEPLSAAIIKIGIDIGHAERTFVFPHRVCLSNILEKNMKSYPKYSNFGMERSCIYIFVQKDGNTKMRTCYVLNED